MRKFFTIFMILILLLNLVYTLEKLFTFNFNDIKSSQILFLISLLLFVVSILLDNDEK